MEEEDPNYVTQFKIIQEILKQYGEAADAEGLMQFFQRELKKQGSVLRSSHFGKICPLCTSQYSNIGNRNKHVTRYFSLNYLDSDQFFYKTFW